MKIISKWLTALALVSGPMVANAALLSVTQDGDLMVSDTALDVTWADVVSPGVIWDPPGEPGTAQAWVQSLNTMVNQNGTIGYGGYTNWTLATGDGSQPYSTPDEANQLGYLFYTELGNPVGNGVTQYNTNFGPFQSLANEHFYWSGSNYDTFSAWVFITGANLQGQYAKDFQTNAIAVRAGDTPAVPLPASAWLLLSGLGALGFMARRRGNLTARPS